MGRDKTRGLFKHWIDSLLPEPKLAADPRDRMRQRLLIAFGLFIFAFSAPWYAWMLLSDPTIRLPRLIATISIFILTPNFLWLRIMPPERWPG